MAFKPNYNQQRAERNRAKEQKKQEKLERRTARPPTDEAENGEMPVQVGGQATDETSS